MYNYQVDPYFGCEHLCLYCYALREAETDWEKEILIHKNIQAQLIEEISSIEAQTVYIGMETDPYQPSERTRLQTRKVLGLLAEKGFSVCILTKSGLVTRDIDILSKMSSSSVGISIAFQDEETRKLFEANSPSNQERIEALRKLKEAGIETYCLICPTMPNITDVEVLIEMIEPVVDTIWIYPLMVKSEDDRDWQNILQILKTNFPQLVETYREIAFSPNHSYWKELKKKLIQYQRSNNLNLRIEF
jgi:DNA repair photolyase